MWYVNWLHENWLVLVLIAGLGVSFLEADTTSRERDRAQRSQLVVGCERSSLRTAINASFAFDAAATRRASGDLKPAAKYAADAQGMLDTIPATLGFQGSRTLAKVIFKNGRAALAPAAQTLQRQGCERAYP